MDTTERTNNIATRIITIVLAALFIIGIAMFDYACYAAEECKDIDSYYPQETSQIVYAADQN